MTHPFRLTAALLLGLAASPGWAQTAAEPEAAPEAESEAAAEPAAPQVLTEYDADTVVLTANGTAITLGELIAVRQTLPEQYQQLAGEVLLGALSDQFATQTLLAEAARKAGIADRRDVAMRLRTQEQALLAETYLRTEIAARVTKEKIEEVYAARYANAEPVDEVRAGHILVETEEAAKDLKAQLDEGADFAELAAEHGTDGTAQRGGDLGWFIKADMVPEFADAAFAMEAGQISDPVQSPFGWHLIKLEDRRPREAPPLEAVEQEISAQLIQEAEAEVIGSITSTMQIERPEIGVPGDAIKQDELLAE